LEIDQIMAKLEQDNKFLEDLERQRAERKMKKTNNNISDSGFLSQSSLAGSANNSPTAKQQVHYTR